MDAKLDIPTCRSCACVVSRNAIRRASWVWCSARPARCFLACREWDQGVQAEGDPRAALDVGLSTHSRRHLEPAALVLKPFWAPFTNHIVHQDSRPVKRKDPDFVRVCVEILGLVMVVFVFVVAAISCPPDPRLVIPTLEPSSLPAPTSRDIPTRSGQRPRHPPRHTSGWP